MMIEWRMEWRKSAKSRMNIYIFIFLFCSVVFRFLSYCCRQYDDDYFPSLLFSSKIVVVCALCFPSFSVWLISQCNRETREPEKRWRRRPRYEWMIVRLFVFLPVPISILQRKSAQKEKRFMSFKHISFILLISMYVNFILSFLRALTCFM